MLFFSYVPQCAATKIPSFTIQHMLLSQPTAISCNMKASNADLGSTPMTTLCIVPNLRPSLHTKPLIATFFLDCRKSC